MPTLEYLESILNKAREFLPDWLWRQIHQAAMPSAGGRARWREPEEPGPLEKMALADMRPEKLRRASDEEVRLAWLRLNQWYGAARKRGDAVEPVVNAAIFVLEEFDRRGFEYDPESELVQEAKKLHDVKKAQSLEAKLAGLPQEVVVIPNFVCVVGSAAAGKEDPEDIDVLFRAKRDPSGEAFLIDADNVWLPVRKVLDPEKKGILHFIDGPQGSHADFIPCYSLVLRREEPKRQVVKEALPKPIRSPGGKDACLDILLSKIPPHKTYVEPYAGGGSLFWAKEPSGKEVLADVNPDIVALYKFLQTASDEDFAWMQEQKWDWSPSHFEKLKNGSPRSLREKAYRYKYLNLFGRRGETEIISPTARDRGYSGKVFLTNLERYRERLKGVIVLQEDALKVMRKYDSPDTFFYLDPPWKSVAEGKEWRGFDEEEFVRTVKGLKGKVLISYQGDLDLGERFNRYSYTRSKGGIAADSRQTLYWNYEVRKAEKTRFIALGTGAMDSPRLDACLLVLGAKNLLFDAGPDIKPEHVRRYADRLDAVLVTDPSSDYAKDAKRIAEEFGAEFIVPEKEGAVYESGGLKVTARNVEHTNHPVYGFLIEMPDGRAAWAPEFWQVPEWIRGVDLAFLEGSAWGRPIAFTGGVGGHAAVLDTAEKARNLGVKQIVFTHIGKPTEEALEKGAEIEGAIFARDGQEFVLKGEPVAKAVSPSRRFSPQKPQMAGTTEFFSTGELWLWVEEKLKKGAKLVGEVKFDGFRCILSRDGGKVSIWFEDAKEDRAEALPALVEVAKKAQFESFVLDGEMLAMHNGKLVPRTQLMEMLAGESPFRPLYHVFDCLYLDGEDLSGQPLSERRKAAEKVVAGLKSDLVRLSRAVPIEDKKDLEIVGKWAASQPGSEGLVVKDVTKPYQFGGSDDWAKWKTVFEIKVAVLKVERTQNGWTYHCGLRDPGEFTNVIEVGGQKYVELGKTFVTEQKVASEGDTLNVRIEELLILRGEGGPKLAWGKPTVVGPDKSRPAYTAGQAVDLARRGHVLKEEVKKQIVPSAGPEGARIAFVGASPGPVEAARGEPFVGPSGETLNELYLKPLGLTRGQVFLTNAVPVYLTDDKGRVREPTDAEIEEWRGWLMQELDRAGADVVVALGQKAKAALGERADFVLPHPMAVRRFGDSGEVGRKLKQIRQALERVAKAADLEEGDTRAEVAAKFWAENWHRMFPPDGKGRYVYHHHYRGLSEEEAKLDEEELLKTDHSLHGDLRFEADGELWGFSVFLGTTEENRKAGGDRFVALPPDDNLQGSFKLSQPKAWLDVASKRPYVSEPGGVGATSQKYAKFFQVDSGTYEIGVWREHMFEIFLHGDKLKGRFLIEYAPVADGRRVWLIDKPKDQTPYAESRELSDVIRELREKGQRWLVWRNPKEGGRPQKIDVRTGRVVKEYYATILKADEERQIVYGVVLEPDTPDSQGDVISADEIEKAAHRFLVKSRVIGLRHSKKAPAEVVESYIAPDDFEMGGQRVKKGSWMLGVHITDSGLWSAIKQGEYQSFSVGGFGTREEIT